MTIISNTPYDTIFNMHDKIEQRLNGSIYLEEAAQKYTDVMYEEFKESIVLTRLFATIPFGKLPAPNQVFVRNLAASAGISHLIRDQMFVLSLLGTRGKKATWNSRHDSEGHVGIPMASADFIDAIPMVSRLLKELGLGLDWIDSQDTEIVGRTIGRMAGVFHVLDAKTNVDNKNRKIIAAQDFVETYSVKTVFGLGGSYLYTGGNTFLVNIMFTNETIEKRQAERFMGLLNTFKTVTASLDANGKVFA